MATREFTITEIVSEDLDSYTQGQGGERPARFVFTAAAHTVPEGGWRFGLEQRTKRQEYPGSSEPSEQVLGPNLKPFTLHGTWDDKWAGQGFAVSTWREFEALVARGRLCEFALEGVKVIGRITDADFDYRRASRILYQFTVSPHVRVAGEATERRARREPELALAPRDHLARLEKLRLALAAMQAEAIATALAGSVLDDLVDTIDDVVTAAAAVGSAIDTRTRLASSVDGGLRIVQAFTTIRARAATLAAAARAVAASDLAYEAATSVMAFDAWTKSIGAVSLQMAAAAGRAAVELGRRLGPAPLALYQPHAGESLYAVSLAYYGTAHRWREIAERNNLTRPVLTGDELLVIPRAS